MSSESPQAAGPPGRRIERAGLLVRERATGQAFNLRGDPGDAAFARAIGAATGLRLPAPGAFTAADGRLLAWLGPDEFLLMELAARTRPGTTESDLCGRAAGAFVTATEIGAGLAALEVSGVAAREFLARGWALDLHPRAFAAGQCAQSLLAKAPVLLACLEAAPVYGIVVRRSYAGYLWAWLGSTAGGVPPAADPHAG
jgi:sarcosine oxidase subunit gamma